MAFPESSHSARAAWGGPLRQLRGRASRTGAGRTAAGPGWIRPNMTKPLTWCWYST